MPFSFANPLAILALSSLIPLIILYLIKPKPKDVEIPSLIFILDAERREDRHQTILKKVVRDPLMLMQLLFLILLTLAMMSPSYVTTADVRADHTVIILDASASMQAEEPSRFDLARAAAEKFVSGKTSIILAKNVPILALDSGSKSDAISVLQRIQPGATTANIGDAIILAKSMIEDGSGSEREDAIVIISDFSNADFGSISSAKMLANAAGIDVTYKQVGSDVGNIGITYGKPERKDETYNYLCTIKNYFNDARTVPIEVFHNGKKTISSSVTVQPHASELFALKDLAPGATVIALRESVGESGGESESDLFDVDDRAYIAIPDAKKRRIMFITETESKNPPAKIAIGSLQDTECSIVKPPVLPSFDDYDIVVVGTVAKDSLLPGTFGDLASFVAAGGSLVVLASGDLGEIATENVLPVSVSGKTGSAALTIRSSSEFTKDIAFEDVSVGKHLKSAPVNGSVVTVVADDGSPMLAYQKHGSGTVVYFGFGEGDPEWNDFHTRVDYPIFWRQIVDWMSGVRGIEEYNVRTGRVYPLAEEQEVLTPAGTVTTDNLLFDSAGGYRIGDLDIAANLYDPLESDLTVPVVSEEARILKPDTARAEVEKGLWGYLTVLVMFLAGFELYYLRARGEL